jgi:hypothetical protein
MKAITTGPIDPQLESYPDRALPGLGAMMISSKPSAWPTTSVTHRLAFGETVLSRLMKDHGGLITSSNPATVTWSGVP